MLHSASLTGKNWMIRVICLKGPEKICGIRRADTIDKDLLKKWIIASAE